MSDVLPTKEEIKQRKKDRYGKRAAHADEWGRIIEVRPLRPSEQLRIMKMIESEDANLRGMCSIAATVTKIGEADIPFPRTFEDLCATVDELDNEGMEAVGAALRKLNPSKGEADEDVSAKNSITAPTSDAQPS